MEIVGKHKASEEGGTEEFVLPNLTKLTLGILPKLKYVCFGRMKLLCPKLMILSVYHCGEFNKSQIFTLTSQSYNGTKDEISTSNDYQSLPTKKQYIKHEKELLLTKEDEDILVHNVAHASKGIKCLRMHCFHNVTEPSGFCWESFTSYLIYLPLLWLVVTSMRYSLQHLNLDLMS